MNTFTVYFLYDSSKNLLYIGKSIALKNRLMSHFSKSLIEKESWKKEVDKENIVIYHCSNDCDLELYETYFINKYKPKYNKDKVFTNAPSFDLPYLEPSIYIFKQKQVSNFQTACEEYVVSKDSVDSSLFPPLIPKAYELLGAKKLKAARYRKNEIERELANLNQLSDISISDLPDYKEGDILTKKQVKLTLQSIYDKLGLKKTAKASDLSQWFEMVDYNKRIDGNVHTLLKIMGKK